MEGKSKGWGTAMCLLYWCKPSGQRYVFLTYTMHFLGRIFLWVYVCFGLFWVLLFPVPCLVLQIWVNGIDVWRNPPSPSPSSDKHCITCTTKCMCSVWSTYCLWDSTGKWIVFDVGQTILFLKLSDPTSEHALDTWMHLSCCMLFTFVTILQSRFLKV